MIICTFKVIVLESAYHNMQLLMFVLELLHQIISQVEHLYILKINVGFILIYMVAGALSKVQTVIDSKIVMNIKRVIVLHFKCFFLLNIQLK
jgi:L-ribulose-5-phosphate 3-epimerase UlaE